MKHSSLRDAIAQKRLKHSSSHEDADSDFDNDSVKLQKPSKNGDEAPKGTYLNSDKSPETMTGQGDENGLNVGSLNAKGALGADMQSADMQHQHALHESLSMDHGDFAPKHGNGADPMEQEMAKHVMGDGQMVPHNSLASKAKVALLSKLKNKQHSMNK